MANPSDTHRQDSNPNPTKTASPIPGLRHDPGISTEWSKEEQTILEDGLVNLCVIVNELMKGDDSASSAHHVKKLMLSYTCNHLMDECDVVNELQKDISLLCRTRDNILKIMNELNDMPDVMKQMPPLPFKLNEKLANTMLPYRPNLPMK
uniref:Uncharacterized protein n=1 Tax=Manihot esculenta TaxID=3983 RepID=A0A2C9V0V8_MANES